MILSNYRVVVKKEMQIGAVDKWEYVNVYENTLLILLKIFIKRLMFCTEDHKLDLGQLGAWLSMSAEESVLTASGGRLFCPTAREENRLRKLTVLLCQEPLINHKRGAWSRVWGLGSGL